MVLGVPLAKFVPELFKAFSKPFLNVLKKNVPKSPFWKDKVFVPMAMYYNKQSVRVRLWTQGVKRNKEQIERSSHMSEEAALELGAEIVANTATFAVGLIAILIQQSISARTEREKSKEEETTLERLEKGQLELRRKVLDLGLDLQRQDAMIRELSRTVASLPAYGKMQPVSNNTKTPITVGAVLPQPSEKT